MARAVVLPKRFPILFFSLGLAAALIGAGAIIELCVVLLTNLSGSADAVNEAVSLGAIVAAGVALIILAKGQKSIIALLAGFIVGCLVQFVIALPLGVM